MDSVYVKVLLHGLNVIGVIVTAMFITYGGYLMMMPLKRKHEDGTLKGLNTLAIAFCYAWLAIFVILDTAYNIVFATIIFLDIPREFLTTSRLDRYMTTSPVTSWRYRVARYFCKNLLDPFDPDGHHCDQRTATK